jgi:myb proto-oncogene protein
LSIKLGVKKGKSKISSSKFSKKIEANFNTKLSSNERLIPSNKTETELQNVIEDSHEKEIEITSAHEPILASDCYENFWLFNDDSYLYTPSLMELLDESLESFMA